MKKPAKNKTKSTKKKLTSKDMKKIKGGAVGPHSPPLPVPFILPKKHC